MIKVYHSYHLVDPSPWPYVMGCGVLLTTVGAVVYFHYSWLSLLLLGIFAMILSIVLWLRDVIREATFLGHHSTIVVSGLKIGFILFIVSEVLFFFSFFWAFFHSSLSPSIEIGATWPPVGVSPLNPFSVPLLNTVILLGSGATITWAHYSIINGNRSESIQGLCLTVILGILFTVLQVIEYMESPFSIADSVYGSIFFVATGFHGLHVVVGTVFLLVCLFRLVSFHLTRSHHFGFEAASWYWHFVDVVWLFLYVFIYWWGC